MIIKWWCLLAYLHPAEAHPNRVSIFNKPVYIIEIKLSWLPPPYRYKDLQKIQEFNKDKVIYNCG